MTHKPPCPQCRRTKDVVEQADLFFCTRCKALFDDDPSDFGSATSSDPVRSAIQKEEIENRRRSRKCHR